MSEKWLKAEAMARKIVVFLILAGAAFALFLLSPKLISLFLPFIIGYIISLIASPLTRLFEKIHLPSSLSAIIAILLVAAALFGVSAVVINKLVGEIYDFSLNLPRIYQSVTETLSHLKIAAIDIFNLLPDEFEPYIFSAFDGLSDSLSVLSASVVETISNATLSFVKHIPGVLIAIVFSVLASYFLARDKHKLKAKLRSCVSLSFSNKVGEIKNYLADAVFAYLKAQSILMSITFVEVFIGLSILNVRYSFLFAIFIAVVDAIPVFGTGTILIPWAIYHLITGGYRFAVGLLIIYGVCLLVRQFLEPKILSSQIGVHPLITLLSMYIGYRLIGVFGMILAPLVALVAKNIITRYNTSHAQKEEAH
ncbi:MAG: sporulation integral membrane protein YtvI [Clostridia bacterium]|nr:sporulation integral membrane protein YtvI [Clostridia bacterium]